MNHPELLPIVDSIAKHCYFTKQWYQVLPKPFETVDIGKNLFDPVSDRQKKSKCPNRESNNGQDGLRHLYIGQNTFDSSQDSQNKWQPSVSDLIIGKRRS